MSGIIKQERAGGAVGRLPAGSRAVMTPPRDPRIDALEVRIAELERTLDDERAAVKRTIAGLQDDARRLVAEARIAGRDDAIADERKRLALLERGIDDAVSAWRDRLAATDGLAADLAAIALRKVFGDAPDLSDLIARTLAHHVERLGRHAVVGVAVSTHDFRDVAALATRAGLPAALVTCEAELPAGACRVGLRVGAIDLDPVTQWSVYDAALSTMASA